MAVGGSTVGDGLAAAMAGAVGVAIEIAVRGPICVRDAGAADQGERCDASPVDEPDDHQGHDAEEYRDASLDRLLELEAHLIHLEPAPHRTAPEE